jgi:hypothetical protein
LWRRDEVRLTRLKFDERGLIDKEKVGASF